MSDADRLQKRLEREKRARREAEAIAERVTSDLYNSTVELERLNTALNSTNAELQAVNQSMRDFVAVASHDLRGPLTAILGYSAIMLKKPEAISDEDRIQYLKVIQRQGEHLARMIEDLLTISRIEAGALDVHAAVVRLGDAVRQSINDFAQRTSEITIDAPSELSVIVDPDHLRRIVVNFVTNAFKYGEPPVEIEARAAGDFVEIRVRDHGSGIAAEFLPRLFGRFARADDDKTRSQKGTGLGLSIVQGLAQANGGETWYEPNEPSGSCFTVRLPKAAA